MVALPPMVESTSGAVMMSDQGFAGMTRGPELRPCGRLFLGEKRKGLGLGCVLFYQAGVGGGAHEEVNGVGDGVAVDAEAVEVDALAPGKLGDHDQRGEREALIVERVLMARHFKRE